MKKRSFAASIALVVATFAWAATDVPGHVASDHYVVLSELGQDRAGALSRQLEALFELFGSYFHYDAASLPAKLNVREFAEKSEFDAYMKQVVAQTKEDFVYLHYASPERSELLLFPKGEGDYSASLAHQAFVQYIKANVPNPPLWLREGFAIFFESARWDEKAGKLEFRENLAWLETAKSLKTRNLLMPVAKLLSIGQDEAKDQLDIFYPQAWAFSSFLLNSQDRGYNRLLWESVNALRRDALVDENQGAVVKIVNTWYGVDAVEKAFTAYLDGRKTFPELVALGVRMYADKSWKDAVEAFEGAKALNGTSYIPEYYLGLIAYAQDQFAIAEAHYNAALSLGCDPSIANYALGVNAYAQNRTEDAKTFLTAAKEAAPSRYGEKVDALLSKLVKH